MKIESNMRKPKIAMIVQRYGKGVNGGAEYHCKVLAEQLAQQCDVTVLTSCALDYHVWENVLPPGEEIIDGIRVLRFPQTGKRNKKVLRRIHRKFRKRRLYQKVLKSVGLLSTFEHWFPATGVVTEAEEFAWASNQGPYLLELIEFLKDSHHQFDALLFFTYLFYPTIYGLRVAPQKSILIPTAHDEPPIYFSIFRKVFDKPKAILFNTLSERNFIHQRFGNQAIYHDITGVGIDVPKFKRVDVTDFVHPDEPYLIYIGRIDRGKGCRVLFDFFLNFLDKNPSFKHLKLVLVGQKFMDIPASANIVATGFVSEDLKWSLLESARALVIPSLYESLSLVTLESMAIGVPVIANERCEVLKNHITDSDGGLLYESYADFEKALFTLFDPTFDLAKMKRLAADYVNARYQWEPIVQKTMAAIAYVGDEHTAKWEINQ